jgi:ABC-type sugar transport system ATPase subunit
MDEPLSNLDAKLRVQTRAELVELQRRLAATVVYVTHDQVEAMTMGHRIAILDRGILQQVGAPQDVYARPANLFVARFIGSPPMNTFSGPIAARLAANDGDGREIVAGVRPEELRFAPADGEADGVDAMVVLIESLGHERHVVCRLVDGQLAIVRQAAHDIPPREGGTVRLVADSVHLFDAGTGARIDA